jgi:hypothetical protein
MIEEINIWKELKALRIGVVVRSFIYKYIDWERMWYEPKNKFVKGDKVRLNWRYKYCLENTKQHLVFVFDKINNDNVVDMECGETYNLYWLTRA